MELIDYLKTIQKRLWLVILLVLFTCTASGTLFTFLNQPTYQAVSKLIVNKTNEVDGKQKYDQALVSANIMLINTYRELIKSSPILKAVIAQNPQLNLTLGELTESIKVSTLLNSQVMTISVVDRSYERAALIVNTLAHVFKSELPLIMSVDNLNILSEASLRDPSEPIQTSMALVIIISFIVSLVLSVLLTLLMDYFDRTIRSEADVVKALGVLPLITIQQISSKSLKLVNSPVSSSKVGDLTHVKLSS